MQNKIVKAKEYFNSSFAKRKQADYKLLNCGGIIELYLKDYKKAQAFFNRALKIKDDPKIKNNLSIAEYYLGDKVKAKELLKNVKDLEPSFLDNLNVMH